MINATVNGNWISVSEGTTVLEAAREAGQALPTLCHHESLPPYGSCRLCMVSVTKPAKGLVAACSCLVEEGMVVETNTEEAVGARKLALEFLLARCPDSDFIRALAAGEGVTATRFGKAKKDDGNALCMLCGLCVRVCHELIGAGAICFVGRGNDRKVSTPFDVQSDACIGCGACAEICPTQAIKIEDRGNRRILHTWNTTVPLHTCPECGRHFAPEPTAFLKEIFPEIKDIWSLCPGCRQKKTTGEWLAAVRGPTGLP